MATIAGWTETAVEVAGVRLHLARAGSGRPVLVLHHDIGSPDRLDFYDALARRFAVLVPHHPGYGKSERPSWLRSVRDVAVIYQWLLGDLGIERPSLIGLGFGGWIAAEMATMAPTALHRLVLVGAMGLKPPEGDILDQAILNYIDYARAGFRDQAAFARIYGEVTTDQLVAWDICREMCFRIAWKPYMYSQTLPHLLGGVKARGTRRLGRRRQDRAAKRRRTLCRGLGQCPLRDRAGGRALGRDGAAGDAGPPGRQLYRRELMSPLLAPRRAGHRRKSCM